MSKKHPMSLSMDTEMHEALRKRAEAKGVFISEFVRQLIGHFCLDREDIKPVVLQIPVSVLASKENLKNWLDAKSAGLMRQFFPTFATQAPEDAPPCKMDLPLTKAKSIPFAPEQVTKVNF